MRMKLYMKEIACKKGEIMVQDILVIIFCVIAFGSALWGWWIDSGKGKKK